MLVAASSGRCFLTFLALLDAKFVEAMQGKSGNCSMRLVETNVSGMAV